jgi:hypothetical protein
MKDKKEIRQIVKNSLTEEKNSQKDKKCLSNGKIFQAIERIYSSC